MAGVNPASLPPAQAETVVVTLPAEIDMASAARVSEQLDAAFGPGAGVVVADMTGTRFCDCSGIRALVMAHQRAKASHAELRIVVRPGEVRRVLEMLRLDTVLAIYPRLDIALLANDDKGRDGNPRPPHEGGEGPDPAGEAPMVEV